MNSNSGLSFICIRLWSLLSLRFKWSATALLLATMVGSLLEVIGLAALGLLLTTLTTGTAATNSWLQLLPSSWFTSETPHQQISFILSLCGSVFLFKNLFLATHAWFEATFAFQLQATISERLVNQSLHLNYETATRRPLSEYVSLLTADLGSFVFHTVLPTLTLLSEVILTVAIFLFLVYSYPVVTLAVSCVLTLLGLMMIQISRNSVARLSRHRQLLEDVRMRHIQQTFGNLRDVYIYGAAEHFKHLLASSMTDLASVYRGYQMMATGPRFVLEFALIAVLLSVIAFGQGTQANGALVASVGMFAASGFRLLIGANRLIMSAQSIRFGHSAVERIWEALNSTQNTHQPALNVISPSIVQNGNAILKMEDVTYRYNEQEPIIVSDVNLTVQPSEMIGIIGKSGVGKSTILDILAGLRKPQSGVVTFNNKQISAVASIKFQDIGYVGQETSIFHDTLRKNIAFGELDEDIDDRRVSMALQQAQLDTYANALPHGINTILTESNRNLSGGQRQRLGIARALYRGCHILLLDEPTSALDANSEIEIINTLNQLKQNTGIVIVSHRPLPISICDTVYELESTHLKCIDKKILLKKN